MHPNHAGRGEGAAPALDSSSTALRAGLALSHLGVDDLWHACMGIGLNLDRAELEAVLDGRRRASNHEHDVIAQALNDHFLERGQDHPVAYSDDLDPTDHGGPAAAG